MTGPDPEPLSPFAQALVDLEKLRPGPPADVEARIHARLEQTIGLPQPPSAPVIPFRPLGRSWRWRSVAGTVLAGLAAAAATGAYLREAAQNAQLRERIHQLESERPPPAPQTTAPPAPAPQAPKPPDPSPAERTPPKPAPRAPAPPPKDTLTAEKVLLERARTALLRGEPAAALEALDAHAREQGQGQLAEEREVLRVQALVQLGRREEARRVAEEIRRRYPDSLLLPALESALSEPP